jgi:phosphoenolpyruvate carboxykinase (GTP)
MAKLLSVDSEEWTAQLPQLKEHYAMFGDRLPAELREQLQALETRLHAEA